jgi:hypothetical protein
MFAAAGVAWLLATVPERRVLLTVGDHYFTRQDLPAIPLLAASALLLVLAVTSGAERPAWAATVLLGLAGVLGCIGLWWLSADPLGEQGTVLRLTRAHGVTLSDLMAAPILMIAAICAAVGVVNLVRSMHGGDRTP